MATPIQGTTYRHKNSGGPYTVAMCLPIKLDGVWHENGVTIYVSEETRNTYARLTRDLLESFDCLADS